MRRPNLNAVIDAVLEVVRTIPVEVYIAMYADGDFSVGTEHPEDELAFVSVNIGSKTRKFLRKEVTRALDELEAKLNGRRSTKRDGLERGSVRNTISSTDND